MVTLALLGAGAWGKNYLGTAKDIDGVEIAHVLTSGSDISELPHGLDGIIIATPASTHFALAKELLKKGHNLLIEKPLALSVAEANELKKIWKTTRSKVLVGHLHLYNPAYRAARELAPKLGKLKKVSFLGIGSTPREDVSVLWDWGPHPASLFFDLIHEPITKISGSGSREHVRFSLYYPIGLVAEAEIGWESNAKKRELAIEGEHGKITFDDTKKEQKVTLELNGKPASFPTYDPTPPLRIELEEFVKAIRGEAQTTSNIEVGVRVVELLETVERTL